MRVKRKPHIVILGGGFAGIFAARELEKCLRADEAEITLVNRENFFLFTPMLHEVAASDLDLTHVVNPLRKMVRRTRLFIGRILEIDLDKQEVVATHGVDRDHAHRIPFDHLVIALGGVTNFFGLPGLAESALTMKSLGDALAVRNRVVESLEEADFECCPKIRKRMLTFVVAGGGFAGVETAAAMNDFVRDSLRYYPGIPKHAARVVLVHSGSRLLPELSDRLGAYTNAKLARRGVDVRLNTRVLGVDPDEGVRLSDGTTLDARTVVWTAGVSPNPLIADLDCLKERGRIVVDETLAVPGRQAIWAVGDGALVPDGAGGHHPPTAQHAARMGRHVARNVVAVLKGTEPRPFRFRTLGQLASLGRRAGVAQIFGFSFSGVFAWWLWRTIYLLKLPRLERKLRVALDWTLDLVFTKDLAQHPTQSARTLDVAPLALRVGETSGN